MAIPTPTHVTPYAAGGVATADNIQLRCRAHNGYEAERYFGRRFPSGVREARTPYSHPPEQPPPPSRLARSRHSVRTEYGPGPTATAPDSASAKKRGHDHGSFA